MSCFFWLYITPLWYDKVCLLPLFLCKAVCFCSKFFALPKLHMQSVVSKRTNYINMGCVVNYICITLNSACAVIFYWPSAALLGFKILVGQKFALIIFISLPKIVIVLCAVWCLLLSIAVTWFWFDSELSVQTTVDGSQRLANERKKPCWCSLRSSLNECCKLL